MANLWGGAQRTVQATGCDAYVQFAIVLSPHTHWLLPLPVKRRIQRLFPSVSPVLFHCSPMAQLASPPGGTPGLRGAEANSAPM